MRRNLQDWMAVLLLMGVTVLAPAVVHASRELLRDGCNASNIHWDCYEADGSFCPDHCVIGTPGCVDEQ